MNRILRKDNGITMVTLVTTILLMIIISSVIFFNIENGVELDKLNRMYSDLQYLQDKVDIYYVENGRLPIISDEYKEKSEFGDNIAVNDGDKYYLIDLSELGVNQSDLNNYDDEDYYVNEDSHIVYSKNGTLFEKNLYNRLNKEYDQIGE